MGSMSKVSCRKCSYDSGELLGVGGDIGFAGRPVWTVCCDQQHALVDVWAPETPAAEKRYWHKIPLPAPRIRCPHCRKVHAVWDPEMGVCPKQGDFVQAPKFNRLK